MSKSRKTISVEYLVNLINEFNATSEDIYKDERIGKNTLIGHILMETGNYCGFRYLDEDDISGNASSVGVRELKEDGSYNFKDTDHSRVHYGFNKTLFQK